MRKINSFILSIALIALLTACGSHNTPADPSDNHQGHAEINHDEPKDSHGGHSEHEEQKKTEIKTQAVWTTNNASAQENTLIQIQVQDKQGKAIEQFDINHEENMHLIIVSKDLSYFNHIHPEYKGNGQFQVQNTFPAGGEYKAFADYIPSSGTQQVKSEWLNIQGDAAQEKPLQAESHLIKVVDGKEVTLSFDNLKPNQDVTMTFSFKDATNKQPITNLEPYLGAVGHVVALDRKAETYLHVHPIDEKAKGPDAKFVTSFPANGMYKIWGQFQHQGKVFTVPFVIEVL